MPATRGRDPAVEEEFLGALYKGGELLAAGKIVEAREHLEKANVLAPKNEKAQNLLGLTYFKLGLFDRASEVYERLVNENPADATLRVNLGLVYLKTNNLDRSIREFETATDLEPTHKKAHNYLGLALAQQGTYVKAREHFELAGSDQMAEKMARAIASQSSPSGIQSAPSMSPAAPPPAPKTVVLGEEEPAAVAAEAPPPPPPDEEEPIEVMSDEVPQTGETEIAVALPAAAPAQPEAQLSQDWGAAMPSAPRPAAPPEELPVLEAVVEVVPENQPMEVLPADAPVEVMAAEVVTELPPVTEEAPPQPVPSSPTWLTTETADAPPPPAEATGWVTETVADVPLEQPPAEPSEQQWAHEQVDPSMQPAQSWPAEASQAAAGGTEQWADPSSEATGTWNQDAQATGNWAAEQSPEASGYAQGEVPTTPDDSSWATGETPPAEEASPAAETANWTSADAMSQAVTAAEGSWDQPLPTTPEDSSWATGAQAQTEALPAPDDSSWATGAQAQTEAIPTTPEDSSWATGEQTQTEALPTTPEDSSWATGQAEEPLPTTPEDSSWATGPAEESSPVMADAPAPALDPVPEPSAPLPITVEEPVDAPPPQAAPAETQVPVAAPAGYAPMSPQRLVDLGASGAWVQEPSAGPFHLSADGLAVTVNGEMLLRMSGLIAVVGSIDVQPENRRRRGRPSQEPFGKGAEQMQRVKGSGVIYLEPGRSKFHAVDLTDQNGVSIDDDGAYLREELVYAFEEPISFENGKLTNDAQTLELAHLKGNGRVLLQLDGTLRAMPIPLGAPLVVPVQRMVGWFGRVTPRLMGFGGRGAIELTGEGYALLGTPTERA